MKTETPKKKVRLTIVEIANRGDAIGSIKAAAGCCCSSCTCTCCGG
ncbi:MAG: hypothetical protein ACEPOV_03720 [Hyphomicrobiales bacterium]